MWIFGRKGPSGFSARSTAEEVAQGIDGNGLTAVVTGASSGIGTETSRVLALHGVHVIMAVRNMDAGRNVKETILKEIPTAKVDVMELDLSSLASVRKFASEYKSSGLPLNLLINNAGVMATPFLLSHDNIELQFATNHLGHFLLTNLLLETMKNTAHESGREGRIVNVSSEGHRFPYSEGICFDKINDESAYNSVYAYGQSKLANILHANELAKRLQLLKPSVLGVHYGNTCMQVASATTSLPFPAKVLDDGPGKPYWGNWLPGKQHSFSSEEGVEITANSLHPGAIATNLLRYHSFLDGIVNMVGKYLLKNIPQGAATTCYVALHPQVKGVSGEYFADSNMAKPSSKGKDAELGKKLWEFSISLTEPN